RRVRDGGFSSCTLFGLMRDDALNGGRLFEGGGQFGKRHIRILKAFGLWSFLLYQFKLSNLEGLIMHIGRRLGVSLDISWLDYPWGPIDVDDKHSFELTEATLVRRRRPT